MTSAAARSCSSVHRAHDVSLFASEAAPDHGVKQAQSEQQLLPPSPSSCNLGSSFPLARSSSLPSLSHPQPPRTHRVLRRRRFSLDCGVAGKSTGSSNSKNSTDCTAAPCITSLPLRIATTPGRALALRRASLLTSPSPSFSSSFSSSAAIKSPSTSSSSSSSAFLASTPPHIPHSVFLDYEVEAGAVLGVGGSACVVGVRHRMTAERKAMKVLEHSARAVEEADIWAAIGCHPHIMHLDGVYDNVLGTDVNLETPSAHAGSASSASSSTLSFSLFSASTFPLSMFSSRGADSKSMKSSPLCLRRGVRYLFLIMERVDGGDLLDYMTTRGGPLEEKLAREVMRQLTSALDHIHTLGYVHGDVKLENVLVCSPTAPSSTVTSSPLPRVKLCDFGFARREADAPRAEYTLRYVSPEALESMEHQRHSGASLPFGCSADVWALGVMLYVMLSGKEPFPGADAGGSILSSKGQDGVGITARPAPGRGVGDARTLTPSICNAVRQGRCASISGSKGVWARVSLEAKAVVRSLLTPAVHMRMDLAGLMASAWMQGDGKVKWLGRDDKIVKREKQRQSKRCHVYGGKVLSDIPADTTVAVVATPRPILKISAACSEQGPVSRSSSVASIFGGARLGTAGGQGSLCMRWDVGLWM